MTDIFPPGTPYHGLRRPLMLILHGTEVDDATSREILSGRSTHQGSCHYYIDDKGQVTQYLDETARAWHAGKGFWSGMTDINSLSIGIELMALSGNRKFNGADTVYTQAQIDALIPLAKGILERNKINAAHVLAHQDVSCTRLYEPVPANSHEDVIAGQPVGDQRKYDPGPSFPWQELAANGIGLWHDEEPEDDPVITDQPRLKVFALKMQSFGYDMRPLSDVGQASAIRAFQTHFMPWNISGQVTEQSLRILDILLEKKYL